MNLKPGNYRYSELAEACGVSRTTAEKFKERYGLSEVIIMFNGREVKGVAISEENCSEILTDIQRDLQGVAQPSYASNPTPVNTDSIQPSKIEALIDRVLQQSETIVEVQKELAQKSSELMVLNREMESRNAAIVKYRDQEEQNRKLERENSELKAKLDLLERQIQESKTAEKAPGWMFWKK